MKLLEFNEVVSFWQKFKRQVLCCTEPYTLISWRFLLPGQSQAICLHRKVFLGAWPSIPRWQWSMIAMYSMMTWYLCLVWWHIYSCLKYEASSIRDVYGISRSRQFIDLVRLGLLHGIPAYTYYDFRLYFRPKKQWLEYIYPHELPQWHLVLSQGVSEQTLHYMADKHAFSEKMEEQGVPVVKTLDFLQQGMTVESEQLFKGCSLFLKPNCGSQSKGAFSLQFDEVSGEYTLVGGRETEGSGNILSMMNAQLQQQGYLIQPLLLNHPDIAFLYGHQLVVLRLVTGIVRGHAIAIFAKLEVPSTSERNAFLFLDIGVSSGRVMGVGSAIDGGMYLEKGEEYLNLLQKVGGTQLPFWSSAIEIATKAHACFSDLPAIGWDIAMTADGVRLLEGNFWWGVDAHQRDNGPALGTRLIEVYASIE